MDENVNTRIRIPEPFKSQEEAAKAIEGFHDEVAELRVKHKLPDVYVVAELNWEDDGIESVSMSTFGFGEQARHEAMLAYALGTVQAERQQRIAQLIGQAIKKFHTQD